MVQSKAHHLLILGLGLVLASCKDTPPDIPPVINPGNVIITSEGNFGWGDGSVSLYDPTEKKVQNDVYEAVNGESPGNVLQSVTKINGQFFFVVNNGQKILITNEKFEKIGEITGFNSPRHIYQVSPNKAYVTDLYSDMIWIIDLSTSSITGSVKLPGWSEKGLIKDDQFWVCNADQNKIYGINIASDQIEDSVSVAYFPQDLIEDDQGRFWVLCRGDGLKRKAQFSIVETLNYSLADSLVLSVSPAACATSMDKSRLYWVSDQIYYIDFSNVAEPKVFYSSNLSTGYAMGVDPQNGDLYFSDVFDYTQKSSVFRLNAEGELLDEFKTGIISGSFYFDH